MPADGLVKISFHYVPSLAHAARTSTTIAAALESARKPPAFAL